MKEEKQKYGVALDEDWRKSDEVWVSESKEAMEEEVEKKKMIIRMRIKRMLKRMFKMMHEVEG